MSMISFNSLVMMLITQSPRSVNGLASGETAGGKLYCLTEEEIKIVEGR